MRCCEDGEEEEESADGVEGELHSSLCCGELLRGEVSKMLN